MRIVDNINGTYQLWDDDLLVATTPTLANARRVALALKGPQTALEWLDALDDWFSKDPHYSSYREQSVLWRILTALRGPDNEDDTLKDTYTVPIRAAAFPKTAEWEAAGIHPMGSYFGPQTALTLTGSIGQHFEGHAIAAAEELVRLRPGLVVVVK